MAGSVAADSAIPLLGGFDSERIAATYPPTEQQATGELAKLVYRLRALDPKFLADLVAAGQDDTDAASALGDAMVVEGEIQQLAALQVPAALIEYLELERLLVLDLRRESATVRVITGDMPADVGEGDRVTGVGVAIELSSSGAPAVIAAGQLKWFPAAPQSVGWTLLSAAGIDIHALTNVGSRNREPLSAADGDLFYAMLAKASAIARTAPAPPRVEAVSLLQHPEQFSGEWLRMELESVQVTRIAVTEPARQRQLGGDHYYQVDAVAALSDVVIEIARADGDDGPKAKFENRYPVSFAIQQLPAFLRDQIRLQEGGDAMVAQISLPLEVDGFFFRLWGYETDYMEKFGGGEQFGPLLIAARLSAREQVVDAVGSRKIGWIAATAVLVAIIAIWIWNSVLARRDRRVKQRRKQSESEQLELPDRAAF